MHLSSEHDDGFTLVELLITLVLMGVVGSALGTALFGFMNNTDSTTRRLGESRDAQLAASYFAQDVSALGLRDQVTDVLQQSVDTSVAPAVPPASLVCGTVTPVVVRFGWDDPTGISSNAQTRVTYVVQTVSGERQLHRITCVGSATVRTDLVLAHNLGPTDPVVTCTAPASCTGAAVPQTVTMVMSLKAPKSTAATYTVTLTGQRRQTS
jgi:prepilin-type N-terminal cleavage/methylation domain-containing protein